MHPLGTGHDHCHWIFTVISDRAIGLKDCCLAWKRSKLRKMSCLWIYGSFYGNRLWSPSGIFIEILDTSCCSWKRNNEEKNGVESCVANSWTFWEPIYFDQGFSLKFGAAMDVCRVERGIMRKMSCLRIRGTDYDYCQGFSLKFWIRGVTGIRRVGVERLFVFGWAYERGIMRKMNGELLADSWIFWEPIMITVRDFHWNFGYVEERWMYMLELKEE